MWRLLEGDAYSDLCVNGAAEIRGRRLFEAQRLFEKYGIASLLIFYILLYNMMLNFIMYHFK